MATTTPARSQSPFILDETYVRQDEHGRFSLNDLHQAAGGEERNLPAMWMRLQQTTALIDEISNCADLHNWKPVESVAGRYGCTYVARELVKGVADIPATAPHMLARSSEGPKWRLNLSAPFLPEKLALMVCK